jgi:hypothetical protein
MPTDRLSPTEARATAGELVRVLAARGPTALSIGRVDLAPALEQQLFFALRDGSDAPPLGRRWADSGLALARMLAATAVSLVPRWLPPVGADPMVALIRTPARFAILDPIDRALDELSGETLAVVQVARAPNPSGSGRRSARLEKLLRPTALAGLTAHQARIARDLRSLDHAWAAVVGERSSAFRAVAARELPRIALAATALQSVVQRWGPSLVIGFDEVGTWSRILPAVARANEIPSLNLPHAEADDPAGLAGASYDRFAVFGPRATAVMRLAGIPNDRIVEIGAPHFDRLIARPALDGRDTATSDTGQPSQILLAAQYVQGAMTMTGLERCHRVALAAATAIPPAEVVVLPHPLQPPGLIEGIVARVAVPAGVAVRVEHGVGLHDLLDGAWLLVTGWSTSVFEAALRGVPSFMVDPDQLSPLPYVAEGLAIGVGDETAARSVALSLVDPAFRAATLERAIGALATHLGPLDGRSSERAARLILSMAGRNVAAAR